MNILEIEILNPKAEKLINDLADLNLISIKEKTNKKFLEIVEGFRKKAEGEIPNMEEITEEVKKVRAERYESRK